MTARVSFIPDKEKLRVVSCLVISVREFDTFVSAIEFCKIKFVETGSTWGVWGREGRRNILEDTDLLMALIPPDIGEASF